MSTQYFRSGGFVTDTVTDFINLYGKVATTGNVCTLRKSGTSSGYQVTAGKTFYITSIKVTFDQGSSVDMNVAFGYADNDVGFDTNTARTNPVPILGDAEAAAHATGGIYIDPSNSGLASLVQLYNSILWKGAPAAKYMYVRVHGGTNACSISVTGFEA